MRKVKPVGQSPIEINGIMLRKSNEVPEGVQALYDESTGQILWVGNIGSNPVGIRATAITLNPQDYEIAVKTHLDEARRAQSRRFRMN